MKYIIKHLLDLHGQNLASTANMEALMKQLHLWYGNTALHKSMMDESVIIESYKGFASDQQAVRKYLSRSGRSVGTVKSEIKTWVLCCPNNALLFQAQVGVV